MNNKGIKISKENKALINRMYFGPYELEWRGKDGLIDNRDETIAKRLELSTQSVSNYISLICERHFDKVTRLRNKERGE
jgi:hypothetical protein